jgi:hypothetical protein
MGIRCCSDVSRHGIIPEDVLSFFDMSNSAGELKAAKD